MLKKPSYLSYLIPGSVVVLGIAVSLFFIASKPSANKIPLAPIVQTVEASPAQYTKAALPAEALGTVVPSQEVVIRSQVPGKILKLGKNMEPGGIVKKGDVLFYIDNEDYKNAAQRSESALAQAKADYELEMGRQRVAKAELTQLKNTLPTQAKKIQASSLALRGPQLAQAKAAIKTAKANLSQSLLDLERSIIRSPFNALIIERNASVGSQASASDQLAKLVDTDSYWVEGFMPLDRFQSLNLAHDKNILATVTSSSGQTFQGKLLRTVGNLDQNTRMGKILIEIPDPLGLKNTTSRSPLILGDHVQINIIAGELEKTLIAPRSLLHNGSYLWILSKNALDIRPVEIAWKDGDNVYIASGVEPGELIITSYLHAPIQGMPLKLKEPNATSPQIDTKSNE